MNAVKFQIGMAIASLFISSSNLARSTPSESEFDGNLPIVVPSKAPEPLQTRETKRSEFADIERLNLEIKVEIEKQKYLLDGFNTDGQSDGNHRASLSSGSR